MADIVSLNPQRNPQNWEEAKDELRLSELPPMRLNHLLQDWRLDEEARQEIAAVLLSKAKSPSFRTRAKVAIFCPERRDDVWQKLKASIERRAEEGKSPLKEHNLALKLVAKYLPPLRVEAASLLLENEPNQDQFRFILQNVPELKDKALAAFKEAFPLSHHLYTKDG